MVNIIKSWWWKFDVATANKKSCFKETCWWSGRRRNDYHYLYIYLIIVAEKIGRKVSMCAINHECDSKMSLDTLEFIGLTERNRIQIADNLMIIWLSKSYNDFHRKLPHRNKWQSSGSLLIYIFQLMCQERKFDAVQSRPIIITLLFSCNIFEAIPSPSCVRDCKMS